MFARLSLVLQQRPLLTAVIYTGIGVFPLFLVSTQILQIEKDLGFGVGQLGIATGTYFGASALTAHPAGGLVARAGATKGFRMGVVLTVAACLMVASTPTPWLIPVATALAGMGNGVIQVAANLAIFDGVAISRYGVAYGAKQAAVPMASVLSGIALPVIGLVFGWRWGFVLAAVLALVLVVSVPHFDTSQTEKRGEPAVGRMPPSLLFLAVAGLTGAVAGNGIALFIVPSAVEIGINEAAAGAVLAVSSVLVVAARIGIGWLVDIRRSSGHIPMLLLVSGGGLGALVLMTAAAPSLYLVAMPVALLGTWSWPGVFFFTLVQSFPEIPARASGLGLSGNLTGTLIGPVVVGALAAGGDYGAAWLFVALAAVVSAVAFGLSYRFAVLAARVMS